MDCFDQLNEDQDLLQKILFISLSASFNLIVSINHFELKLIIEIWLLSCNINPQLSCFKNVKSFIMCILILLSISIVSLFGIGLWTKSSVGR